MTYILIGELATEAPCYVMRFDRSGDIVREIKRFIGSGIQRLKETKRWGHVLYKPKPLNGEPRNRESTKKEEWKNDRKQESVGHAGADRAGEGQVGGGGVDRL
jgi:hypothetical protein